MSVRGSECVVAHMRRRGGGKGVGYGDSELNGCMEAKNRTGRHMRLEVQTPRVRLFLVAHRCCHTALQICSTSTAAASGTAKEKTDNI